MRVGHGFDAHRLVEGRALVLGGVTVPFERGALGHSDADVLAHAVADALLGAAALGDLGGRFPAGDPRWKDADSMVLLASCAAALHEAGWHIVNVDATVVVDRPKLAPFVERMRANVAARLMIAGDAVGIKAKSSEGLGFTGDGSGIAAYAATRERGLVTAADDLARAMQRWGFLEEPVPAAARRWIETFLDAYGDRIAKLEDAHPLVAALRAEACTIPALELERLRSRDVLFFLDSIGQYVDHQPELRGIALAHDIPIIAQEFGIAPDDALAAVRMALTGEKTGPPLESLFPLLGHDRILIRIGAVSSKLLHGRGLEPIAFGPDGKPFQPIRGARPAEGESRSDH